MSIQYDTIMYRTAGWNLSQSNKMKSSVIDFTSFWGRKFPLKVTVALHRLWSMRQWDHHMLSSAMRTCFMSWSHAPMRYALIYSSHLVILVHACHEVFKCVFFWSVHLQHLATTQPQPNQPRMTSVDCPSRKAMCLASFSATTRILGKCWRFAPGTAGTATPIPPGNPNRKSTEIPKNQLRFRAHEAGEQSSIQNIPKRREFIRVSWKNCQSKLEWY